MKQNCQMHYSTACIQRHHRQVATCCGRFNKYRQPAAAAHSRSFDNLIMTSPTLREGRGAAALILFYTSSDPLINVKYSYKLNRRMCKKIIKIGKDSHLLSFFIAAPSSLRPPLAAHQHEQIVTSRFLKLLIK